MGQGFRGATSWRINFKAGVKPTSPMCSASATPASSSACGIFTKSGDKEAFKQAILTLYNDRELCKEMGRNGRQFVMDNLTREVGTQKYVEVIKSVVNVNGR